MTWLVSWVLFASPVPVTPIDPAVRSRLTLSAFYEKSVDAGGLPIIASRQTADAALREAHGLVTAMTRNHPEYLVQLGRSKVRLVVMAPTELTTDVPEHSDLQPKAYWDRRARGLGATVARPAVSCAEENLLGEPGDPYSTESICVHEFAHALHEMALRPLIPDFESRLLQAFEAAKAKGTWRNTYAMTNEREYWAEAVQSWFDTNRHDDAEHGTIDTREEVIASDPLIAALIADALGPVSWRYQKPERRSKEALAMLGPLPDPLPRFEWTASAPAPSAGETVLRDDAPPARSPSTASPETAMSVRNATGATIVLDWVDFAGGLKRYASIAPGAQHQQQTFVGHVWTVRRGERVEWFAASSEPMQIVVRGTVSASPRGGLALSTSTAPARSPKSTEPSTVTIENASGRTLTLTWIGLAGEKQRSATITPGRQVEQPTWAGHVWLVLDGTKRLGWFEAPRGTATLILR
jgi:hypothetical protein